MKKPQKNVYWQVFLFEKPGVFWVGFSGGFLGLPTLAITLKSIRNSNLITGFSLQFKLQTKVQKWCWGTTPIFSWFAEVLVKVFPLTCVLYILVLQSRLDSDKLSPTCYRSNWMLGHCAKKQKSRNPWIVGDPCPVVEV